MLAGVCLAVALTGGPALAAGGVTPAAAAPATAPTFCLAAVAGDQQAQLSWSPATPEAGLAIYEGVQPAFGAARQVGFATGSNATVHGLKDNTTYYFWLGAAAKQPTPASTMAVVEPSTDPLDTWYCLTASAGDGQVQLNWFPSAPAGDISLYRGIDPDSTQADKIGPVSGTTDSADKLANGTTYYFWLGDTLALTAAGDAAPTVVSTMATATPLGKPGAPTGLTATPGNGQVTLSWTVPASDGGAPISRYHVYQGTSPVSSSPVTGTSTTVTGLTNGTAYSFTVTAVNDVGEGPASAPVSATPAAKPGVPGPPGGLTATAGNGQAFLSWTAPASDGGPPVTGYHLYAGTTADFGGAAPIATVAGTAVTVDRLTNGTTYYFKVTARSTGPATAREPWPRRSR